MTSNRTLDPRFSRTGRQKLSAVGLVVTTALLLVMAGVAAGSGRSGDRLTVAALDSGTVKAEMLERTLSDAGR